jgi:hypothetical protein
MSPKSSVDGDAKWDEGHPRLLNNVCAMSELTFACSARYATYSSVQVLTRLRSAAESIEGTVAAIVDVHPSVYNESLDVSSRGAEIRGNTSIRTTHRHSISHGPGFRSIATLILRAHCTSSDVSTEGSFDKLAPPPSSALISLSAISLTSAASFD